MKVLFHQDSRFGRATLEEDREGRLLFSVSGPGRGAPAAAFLLDPREEALFRAWGARFLDVLANRVRRDPAAFASRNLLPPLPDPEGEGHPERGAPGARPTLPAAAATLALIALLLTLAWILDPPSGPAVEREGTALGVASLDGNGGGEQSLLRVELPGGETVLVHAPGDPPLREGAAVTVRERRSRIFGKRSFVFVRYR